MIWFKFNSFYFGIANNTRRYIPRKNIEDKLETKIYEFLHEYGTLKVALCNYDYTVINRFL